MIKNASAVQLSFVIHGLVIAMYFFIKLNDVSFFRTEKIAIEVYQYPVAVSPTLQLQPSQAKSLVKQAEPLQKKVFGLNRRAIVSSQTGQNSVSVKVGNTVAKEVDDLKLDADDPDSIPIPTDDYLVTTQVKLLREVKIPYPAEAKLQNVEGSVVMDLIIDREGKVRTVVFVRGPGAGLNEATLAAAKSFEFRPARVNDQPVAVKIRYTYRFVLENR